MTPLKSSMLTAADWTPKSSNAMDNDLGTLTVTFKSGRSYTFDNVPEDVYQGLITAESPGSYYHENIKGQY